MEINNLQSRNRLTSLLLEQCEIWGRFKIIDTENNYGFGLPTGIGILELELFDRVYSALKGITSLLPRSPCIWNMGTPCKGSVSEKMILFNKISICDQHWLEHLEVMDCHNRGINIERIINWSRPERLRLMKFLGIKVSKT